MKFTSLLSVVLVFAISAANAEKELATLQFIPASEPSPPEYRLRVDLHSSDTSHEIILRTEGQTWLTTSPQTSRGVVDNNNNGLSKGRFNAVINDNDAKGNGKKLTIDLVGSGGEFHYEGTSVTEESIDYLSAEGFVIL
ncbi:hypothetical protein LRAMOSA09624 [Lichtheimia ramosa]|uniref:Uncharacterized protein n=1 Tax=Lichtheimia ramosa TaxID=688394 RepID=A0A077WH68_9FUNG|nr:hypothetical protein LRAMOSA09624 [Lichtheimia ramosa]